MSRNRSLKLAVANVLALCLLSGAAEAREWSAEYEERIGRQVVAAVEKEYEGQRYEDEATLKRVQAIADVIAPHTQRPEVKYEPRLLDVDEANAFSCPGGYIYVTKGLLAAVESDAQLAGVMAHEMAHNCTYDGLEQLKRIESLSLATAAAVVAAVVLGRGDDMVRGALEAGQIATRGILSKYSIDVESRADRNAIKYLLATDHNPVGFLTFMERLAQRESQRPDPGLGIFQTHPHARQRTRAVLAMIEDAGAEINRRAVTKWDPPVLEETKVGEQTAWAISLWGRQLFIYNHAPADEQPPARGERVVATLTDLLAAGVESYEFQVGEAQGQPTVVARGRTMLTVYPEDAAMEQMSTADKAQAVCHNIRKALYAEKIDRMY